MLARIAGLETSRIGSTRRGLECSPPTRSQPRREATRRAQWRLVDRQTPARALGFMRLHPRPFFLRPIHRPDVKRDILIELLNSLAREANPGFCRDGWFQEELRCRVIDTRAMELKIGRNAFERPRAIEHDCAKPSR